jgi:hypothetical protein
VKRSHRHDPEHPGLASDRPVPALSTTIVTASLAHGSVTWPVRNHQRPSTDSDTGSMIGDDVPIQRSMTMVTTRPSDVPHVP